MKQLTILATILFFSLGLKAQDTTRVLFIGNSYTYVNDLPNTFRQLGQAAGKVIIVDSNAPGGYTFNQHSTNATTLAKIAQGNWDYVVLQEQSQMPSFPPFQVESDVYPFAQKLDSLIHAADSCTKTIFYMTWGRKYGDASNCGNYAPLCTYEGMQMRLRTSYMEMAQNNNAMVAPAGMAWRSSWYNDSTINLWSSDLSHPSLEGTYLTACTFYATLFKQNTLGLSYTAGLNANTASFLQHIADSTVLDSLTKWITYFDPASDTLINYTIDASNSMTVHFNGSTANSQAIFWYFGDETFSSELNPSHTFTYTGTFEITKIVELPYCERDTITMFLTVENVGIQETAKPAHFILSDRLLTLSEPGSIEIWNGVGERILVVNSASKQLDLSHLPSGIYLIRTSHANRSYLQKVMLK
jgi:hypothetical protein